MQKVLNILFLFGLAGSLTLHFLPSNEVSTKNNEIEQDSTKKQNTPISTDRIAYINTDSVWANYKRVLEMKDELVAQKLQSENQYKREVEKLEKEFKEFQARSRFQSTDQNQQQQQELMMKEQNIMALQEQLSMRLAQSEQEKNLNITDDVRKAVNAIASEKGFDYVLGYSTQIAGDVIYGRQELDITAQVTQRLNTSYENQQKGKN